MTDEPEFDMEAAVSDVASGLGFGEVEDLPESKPETDDAIELDPAAPPAGGDRPAPSKEGAAPASEAAAPRAPPKSWAKETHEQWAKLDPTTQEYIEKREKDFLDGNEQYRGEASYAKEFKDIIAPYKPMLAAMGVDEKTTIQYLLNAQYRLNNGTPEERMAAYQEIGRTVGLVQAQAADPNAEPLDPAIASLRAELDGVKSALTRVDQERLAAAQSSAQTVVDKFIADPAHSKFAELAPDMAKFIEAGHSLEDAYDKALYANPVLREQEFQRRLTEDATKQKEQKRKEGEDAKRAAAQNVRGVESRKAPTEPKGSMDDTMRATLKEIRSRPH